MVTLYENKEEEKVTKSSEVGVQPRKNGEKLSPFVLAFLEKFEASHSARKGVESTMKVSQVLGSLARLYERIRTTVEYKGEAVLRRNAIERILKRLVWEKESLRPNIDTKKLAETLIRELIWARYLPKDGVRKSSIDDVRAVIEKYLYLLENLDTLTEDITPSKARIWIWGVASSEIEDLLDPSGRELFIKLMYDWFNSNFEWKETEIDEHEKNVQVYLAIHRAYTKSDDPIMRYHLLLREYPDWAEAEKVQVNEFIVRFPKLYNEIEKHLNFPGRLTLYRRVQKHVAFFEIFRSVAEEEKLGMRALLEDEKKFSEKVREVCQTKYKNIKDKVKTGIIRSIIYIFLTKVVFALFLEVPYEVYRYGDVRYLPLSINIVFPPFMMFLIGMSISTPGEKNTLLIISRLESMVYGEGEPTKEAFSIARSRGRSTLVSFFGLLYAILFLLVFGGISYLLFQINFTIFGVLVFFVFLSLVLLFAFRVRYNAKQLKAESEEEDIFGHFFSYLTLPFLNLGFYLSKGLSRLNFLTIILDFLIEAPLKNIIEIFEEWTSFLREKKEEVVEIPE